MQVWAVAEVQHAGMFEIPRNEIELGHDQFTRHDGTYAPTRTYPFFEIVV